MSIAKSVMHSFYRKADGKPERLPWHRESPSRVLVSAVAACASRARALDLGCGAGVFTVWLAEKGLEVTGTDSLDSSCREVRSCSSTGGNVMPSTGARSDLAGRSVDDREDVRP
jgi:2-polyprenyl-3-methyl-5-hydroxy-6-metoxy-1,4-benzoquinol methylase